MYESKGVSDGSQRNVNEFSQTRFPVLFEVQPEHSHSVYKNVSNNGTNHSTHRQMNGVGLGIGEDPPIHTRYFAFQVGMARITLADAF